jgi:hypothetical protein
MPYDGAGALTPRKDCDMGDKSPKAKGKQANQKQAKSDQASQQKKRDVEAKQVFGKKN